MGKQKGPKGSTERALFAISFSLACLLQRPPASYRPTRHPAIALLLACNIPVLHQLCPQGRHAHECVAHATAHSPSLTCCRSQTATTCLELGLATLALAGLSLGAPNRLSPALPLVLMPLGPCPLHSRKDQGQGAAPSPKGCWGSQRSCPLPRRMGVA